MSGGQTDVKAVITSKLRALIAGFFSSSSQPRWHSVVRNDLGLRIDLPAKPVSETEPVYDEDGTEFTVTLISASLGDLSIELSHAPLYRRIDFDAFVDRYKTDMADLFRLPFLGRRSFSWYGHPAADLTYGAPGHYVLIRFIAAGMATIGLTATDRVPVEASPVVQRVLDSLAP
jgi:hypothetical protein